MIGQYSKYSYSITNFLSLEGVRQYVKLLHAYSHLENLGSQSTVIDIGAGAGEFGKMLKQNDFKGHYIAIDLVDKFVDKSEFPDNSEFIIGNIIEKFLVEPKSGDLVVALDSIQSMDYNSGLKLISRFS